MTVPDYQSLMRPVLQVLANTQDHEIATIRDLLSAGLGLTQIDRQERQPSGGLTTFANRTSWALTYLFQAGLVARPRKGCYHITDLGTRALSENPDRIDVDILEQFPGFEEFLTRARAQREEGKDDLPREALSPAEAMARADRTASAALGQELLSRVHDADPAFFEILVLRLLTEMGYGKDAASAAHLGQSGDGGIDGMIAEDRLGLDTIYLQAKRRDPSTSVGRPELHAFVGALKGQGASKGVFITTAKFSQEARDYVSALPSPRVSLINGALLTDLMIEHGLGVARERTFFLNRIDEDFFP